MANLFKIFEDSMTAATFAEAGEHEAAREYLANAKTARKKVLLGTNTMEIPPKVLSHAVGVCKRLGARLEILHVLPAPTENSEPAGSAAKGSTAKLARLKDRFRTLGIPYEFVLGAKVLEQEIIRYAEGRRDIILIVLGISGPAGRRGKKQPDPHLATRFQCPVVLLEEPQPA